MIHALVLSLVALAQPSDPAEWGSVRIGGGGYVTGLLFHPAEPDLVYARTDIGGVYRWDAGASAWVQLFDWSFDERNLWNVESIAVDPTDADVLYAAVGDEGGAPWEDPTLNDLLVSDDRGATWTRLGLHLPMGANQTHRWQGERLLVDPADPTRLWFATRWSGLQRSTDGGASFAPVAGLPSGSAGLGVTFVVADPSGGTVGGATAVLYAGVWGDGIWRSADAGTTWSKLAAGAPAFDDRPNRGVVAGDGTLFATFGSFNGGVARYDGGWTDVSPDVNQFCAVAVDPSDPQRVLAYVRWEWGGNYYWLSSDRGDTWTRFRPTELSIQNDVPWWPIPDYYAASVAATAFDPFDGGRVWTADWYGVWKCDDVEAATPVWTTTESGREELVVLDLAVPTAGAKLLTGAADVDGFRHDDLDTAPLAAFDAPGLQDTSGLDVAATDPELVARVGGSRPSGGETGTGALSVDGGITWTEFAGSPGDAARFGKVALSASGDHLVWIPKTNHASNSTAYWSHDDGVTWTASSGLPGGLYTQVWDRHESLASDRVADGVFYVYFEGQLFVSTDGGVSFALASSIPTQPVWAYPKFVVRASPDRAGELWVGNGDDGLYRSTDFGSSLVPVGAVTRVVALSVGRAAPCATDATVYVYGEVGGVLSLFRSEDGGGTWIDQGSGPGLGLVRTLEASPSEYGVLFVGTSGYGVVEARLPEGTALTPAVEVLRAGDPPNPIALLPGASGPPRIGSVWDPGIDHAGFAPGALLDVYSVSLAPANVPSPPSGTLLCGPALLFRFRAPGVPLTLAIPDDCTLVGVSLCLGGASFDADSTLLLTNAIDFTIGND